MKPWYWEMERAGWGPHFYLWLEFAPQDAPLLQQRLLDSPPEEFHLATGRGEKSYFGTSLLAEEALVWEQENNSEWGFAILILTGAKLEIEHGWGAQGEEDSAWLVELLGDSPVNLQSWSVGAGGDGYNPQYGRRGSGQDTLLRYLAGEVAAPDWAFVEEELRQALTHKNPNDKFTVSECLVENDGETMRAVLLYDVPRSEDGEGWCRFPEWEELIAIARVVGERCDIPYAAASASVHHPDDHQHVIGGSITFGMSSRR